MATDSRDNIYSQPQMNIVDFVFDENVASVFPDMIRRSVPGYDTLIPLLGLMASEYARNDSNIYDLGCSLGAATIAMRRRISASNCRMIAVDNAEAMVSQCRENINRESGVPVDVVCADIRDVTIENASIVCLNFTLQFIAPDEREKLLDKICNGIKPGGVLVLSEKIKFTQPELQSFHEAMHIAFKKANGYSDLEISQKRTALEKILVPDSIETHAQRLSSAGFSKVHLWFQCFNFVSFIAIK